jgi:F-box protein 3
MARLHLVAVHCMVCPLGPGPQLPYRSLHHGQALASDMDMEHRIRQQQSAQAGSSGVRGGGSHAGALDEGGEGGPADKYKAAASIFRGLFGGYVVCDHRVVSWMLPLRRAALW